MTLDQPRGVAYDRHGWIINGRRPFIYGGELHYFRIPPDLWEDRLLKARRAFLNTVGVYMPWNWHAPRPGAATFDGDRDVERWLSLIEAQGMHIIARPGPYICSEWDFGGFPGWLLASPREMRSLDPAYLEPVEGWLAVIDPIIARHQAGDGGGVILYQVENEYFWGDLPYLQHLKRVAESHGIAVPVVANENRAVRGSDLIETLDPYPRLLWDLLHVESAVHDLRAAQPDKPPFGMEVQGGFFSMTGFPHTAFSVYGGGRISPEWTEVYLKTLIAAGLNGLVIYMFHGGTNFARWRAKYVTTTYDFDAAVREWGELSERYYVARRIGGFLASLGETLVGTAPAPDLGRTSDRGVQLLARAGDGAAFLFPRNLGAQERPVSITFAHPATGQPQTIPRRGAYIAAPRSMAILPVSVSLRAGLVLQYCTSQLFHLTGGGAQEDSEGDSGETTLILWERDGFAGELLLSGPPPGDARVDGPAQATVEPDGLLLAYRHAPPPQRVCVVWPDARPLSILILDRERAGRCWLPERGGQAIPLASNLYLLRQAQEQGDRWLLDVELRGGAPVEVAFPCAAPPRAITLDDQPAHVVVYEAPGLARATFAAPDPPDLFWDLAGSWRAHPDEAEAGSEYDDAGWTPGEAGQSLEAQGFYDNGYFWYRRDFELDRQRDHLWMTCPDFTDEATAYVNGHVVGYGLHRLEADIAGQVRPGRNLLALRLESTGREHMGFPWPNGLIQPVYLAVQPRALSIRAWRWRLCAPLPIDALTAVPPEATPAGDDSVWPTVELDPWVDSRIANRWPDVQGVWYRARVDVPAEWAGRALSLEFDEVKDEAWVYVNGQAAGRIVNRAFHSRAPSRALALDGAIRCGETNLLAVYTPFYWQAGGLNRRVRLVAYDHALRQGWRIAPGLGGERAGWASPAFDDAGWRVVDAPEAPAQGAGVAWYRRQVEIALPEGWVTPLRLTLAETPGTATLYFNGTMIGRYGEEGPQRDFYIYEPLLRRVNTVALAVDGRGKPARLGRVSISPYCTTRRSRICVQW